MLRITFLLLLFNFIAVRTWSQEKADFIFDTTSFEQNSKLAAWIYEYDAVAMLTADSLKRFGAKDLCRSGTNGFCFTDNSGTWHAVLPGTGKREQKLLFHYTIDSNYNLHSCKSTSDSALIRRYKAALFLTSEKMKGIQDSANIHFNQYIRQLPDKKIEVWVLPAFQPSGQAIYGAEWRFTFNSEGFVMLDSYSQFTGLKGVWIGQPRELWLNYRQLEAPTPGSVVFAWLYKDYFTRIRIDTNKSTSTLHKNVSGLYTWEHKLKGISVTK